MGRAADELRLAAMLLWWVSAACHARTPRAFQPHQLHPFRRPLIPSLKPVLPSSSRLVSLLNRGMLRAPWQQAV